MSCKFVEAAIIYATIGKNGQLSSLSTQMMLKQGLNPRPRHYTPSPSPPPTRHACKETEELLTGNSGCHISSVTKDHSLFFLPQYLT